MREVFRRSAVLVVSVVEYDSLTHGTVQPLFYGPETALSTLRIISCHQY
jgi:hypothetical protein